MLKFIKGFGYAFSGVSYAFRTQLNFKFHIAALLVTIFAGCYFGLSINEWLWIIGAASIVLITELLNTAIEVLVDLVSPTIHPKAKIVKDVAAAGVLIAAVGAAIIGFIIFLPKIC